MHILQHFFRVPVKIEEFVGHWMFLSVRDRSFLAGAGASLGSGAVLGDSVWDRQHKFRIHLGPLTLAQYESFLPGGSTLGKLVDWVRMYFCFELDWDVRLLLKAEEVPMVALGKGQRLGFTTWLGARESDESAGDLCLDAEALTHREGALAA
jgi:type VI secretion system protein ImpH